MRKDIAIAEALLLSVVLHPVFIETKLCSTTGRTFLSPGVLLDGLTKWHTPFTFLTAAPVLVFHLVHCIGAENRLEELDKVLRVARVQLAAFEVEDLIAQPFGGGEGDLEVCE